MSSSCSHTDTGHNEAEIRELAETQGRVLMGDGHYSTVMLAWSEITALLSSLDSARADLQRLEDELAKAKRVATNSATENQRLRADLQRLEEAVAAAERVDHMNRNGVALGPRGKHEPGTCRLCDALAALHREKPQRGTSSGANLGGPAMPTSNPAGATTKVTEVGREKPQ